MPFRISLSSDHIFPMQIEFGKRTPRKNSSVAFFGQNNKKMAIKSIASAHLPKQIVSNWPFIVASHGVFLKLLMKFSNLLGSNYGQKMPIGVQMINGPDVLVEQIETEIRE